jgi:hypothetical protein
MSEEEAAGHAARMQFLQQQALNFMNQIRMVKISLLMADQAGELSGQLKEFLYNELLQCAGIVEVKK